MVVDQEMISALISTKPFDFMTSPLGRVLSTIQGLMQHKYQLSWPYALPIVGRLFLHLKEASYPILAKTLKASSKNICTWERATSLLNIVCRPIFCFTQELGQLQTKLLDAPSSAAPPGSQAAINVS